ncbi:GTPase [Selenomonas sp.]|uniref:GTPase n=3 Tax=Selenomonas sp. TaxID=2053611 RepID=UPI002A7F2877|nr:GTPase [Selenomonas sp.]MDY4415085.1 GTPase [Selenomonas sp.]
MRDQELAEALQACQAYAQRGYDFANSCYQEIHTTMKAAKKKLKETDRRQSQVDRIANSAVIARERENVEELRQMDWEIQDDLQTLLEQQKEFSVVVFGRTMAGKSTLMEILTHGNGESIGKGAQRTTRDVRDYRWKGMKVTDVPGICSFDGREDDELAMRAAKSADLILFLITDDAPQDSEAEKLAELKRLGKNVLGVINVKLGLNLERRKMSLRDLEKKMDDDARIDEICNQFRAFGPRYHQDWSKLPFVATHLQAAYLGRDDPELYALSNFDAVEEYILDKVQRDASFLRMKTFIDRVSVPLSDHIASILDDAADTMEAALSYRHKWHELDDWNEAFIKETQEKYNRFMQRLRDRIDEEIQDFAEDNYENKDAGEDWNDVVAAMHIETQCRNFLKERAEACNRKRRELADEFATEIRFASKFNADADDIGMEDITNFSSLFGGAAAVTALIPGIGWTVSIGLGVLSLLFDSKEKQIREAKETLRSKLKEAMDPFLDKISEHVLKNLNEEILQKGVRGFQQSLVAMDEMFFELADAQTQLAVHLDEELSRVNRELWEAALHSADPQLSFDMGESLETNRLPGRMFVMFAPQKLPTNILQRMESLLEEEICLTEYDPEDDDDLYNQVVAFVNRLIGEQWAVDSFDYGTEDDLKAYYVNMGDNVEEDSVGYRMTQQMFCDPILRL